MAVLQTVGAPLATLGQRAVYLFGDSFVAQADGGSGNNLYAQLYGNVWTWAQIYAGGRVLRVPGTNNFGVGGNTSTQMLARVSTLVAALTAKAGVVVIAGGSNDVDAPIASSVSIANFKGTTPLNAAQSIYGQILATGSTIIKLGIIPRSGGSAFTAGGVLRALAINEADRRYAEVTPGFFFVDLDPVCTDLTAATWTVLSGILGSDGVHPSCIGSAVIGKQIANILNFIFPSWRKPTMTNSDVYNATDSLYGNFLTNGLMLGTSGSATGGVTGTAANNVTVDGASMSGATAVASVASGSDGRKNQILTISGSKTGNTKWVDVINPMDGALRALLQIGDVIEAEVELSLTSHTNIAGVDVYLQTNEAATFFTVHGSNPNPIADPMPTDGFGASPVIIKTGRRTITGSLGAGSNITIRTYMIDGSVSVVAALSIASMSVRKVL